MMAKEYSFSIKEEREGGGYSLAIITPETIYFFLLSSLFSFFRFVSFSIAVVSDSASS